MCVFIIITFAAERTCARSACAQDMYAVVVHTSSVECVYVAPRLGIYFYNTYMCIFPYRHVNKCICGARGLKCAESAKIPLFSNETHTEYYYYKIPTIKL